MNVALILVAAILFGATLAYVLSPLLWPQAASPVPDTDEALEELLRRRAAAYQAIRDLEADYRLGSLDEHTYAAARAELEQRAIEVLRALDEWEAEADSQLAQVSSVPPRAAHDELASNG